MLMDNINNLCLNTLILFYRHHHQAYILTKVKPTKDQNIKLTK